MDLQLSVRASTLGKAKYDNRAIRMKLKSHNQSLVELPAYLCDQLEQHRFAFAKLLLRLNMQHLYVETLSLTRAALRPSQEGTLDALQEASGVSGTSLRRLLAVWSVPG